MGREEQGEGGDRGDLVEKKESQKGERAIKPVITLPSKNGSEDWILKGTKLITSQSVVQSLSHVRLFETP